MEQPGHPRPKETWCRQHVCELLKAGLHRTGFFIYVLLRRHGLTPQEALEALRMTRRRTYDEMTWMKGRRPTLVDKAETAFNALFGKLA